MKINKILLILMIGMFMFSSVAAKDFIIRNETSGLPYFVVNGTSGFTGIGTGTPSTTLQIVTSGVNGVVVGDSDYPSWMGAEGLYVDGSFRANSYLVNSDSGIRWGTSKAQIIGHSPSAGAETYLSFLTGELATYGERMRITDNGNIGIGTITPQNKLNVIGDGNFTGNLYTNGNQVLTSISGLETDPLWTANQSFYPRISELVGFVGNFSAWNKNYADLINSPTLLSDFTDDLGDRGYTDLSNFTNGPGYLTSVTGLETDPLWTANQSSYSTKVIADTLYYAINNPSSYYNSSDFVISDYYLNSNPAGYYNSTTLPAAPAETDPYWTANQSSYSTKVVADTLYYGISNPSGYYNSTTLPAGAAETDPYWTGNFSSRTGTGNVVYNTNPAFIGIVNAADLTLSGTLDMGDNPITNINWATSDDGAGSGLDADLLDGYNSSDFLSSGIQGSGTLNYLPKFTAGSTLGDSLIYDSGTNVGIGTITPDSTLDVEQGADDSGIIVHGFDDRATSWVKLNVDSAGYGALDSSNGFRFRENGVNIAYIDKESNNGFRIYNDVAFSFGTAAGRYSMGYDSSNGDFRIAQDGSFLTDNNVKLVVQNSTGNVGIGTITPDAKLDVEGDAIVTGKMTIGNSEISTLANGDVNVW